LAIRNTGGTAQSGSLNADHRGVIGTTIGRVE
jgi:hypothetical protein